MRALLQDNRSGRLEVADLPPPLLRPQGVLVRTAFSLISPGTERATREVARKSLLGKALARPDQARAVLEVARREGIAAARERVQARLGVTRPLGYSSAGIVLETGAEAGADLAPGTWVACAGGGYANHAELVYVPRTLCAPLPPRVSLESAAFGALGAIALQGVRQADVRLGERVAVIGLGLVGQLAAQLLRAAGCAVLGIDLDAERCRLAERLGTDLALPRDPDTARRASEFAPLGVDAVLIAADSRSNDPIELAAELCRDRGRVVVLGAVGMHVPREPFYRKELELRLSRSSGPGRYDPLHEEQGIDYPFGYVRWTEGRNLGAFLDLLARGSVSAAPLVTQRMPLEQAEAAYALVEGRASEPALGVLFTYPTESADVAPRVTLSHTKSAVGSAAPGIGLLGAGGFAAAVLLPALREASRDRLRWRGIASAGGISALTLGRRFGFDFCATDAAEVVDDPHTRAVLIATRHDRHAALASAALEAGKIVFVEKPLALSLDELRQVTSAVSRSGQPLMVGFNRRFSPLTQALRAHFRDVREPLALLARVNAGSLAADHWSHDPAQGGRILGEACHFLDLMHYLAASPPLEVHAWRLPDLGLYQGDNVVATIRFANGSLGTLHYLANGDRGLGKERIEVLGGGRSAVIDDFREALLYHHGTARRVRASGQDKGHRAEMEAFVGLLLDGGQSPLPFADAALSTLATLAVSRSLESGETVRIDAGQIWGAAPVETRGATLDAP